MNKQELHRIVDHLDQAELDEVHDYLIQLRNAEEVELSKGQMEGFYDQDEYFEEGEVNEEDVKKREDMKLRE
ncbi:MULTISPECIES: hypothetical protein [Alteribacter]|uniref:DUF2281 domain-containing protein n=1 Tax=Alteribacter keqinensis TaxID=2483800 RepID=A0A3M7TMI4_9BACI|nr:MULTISPECIES: hypothetical protein [Alteribacter]MBM7095028.1 hypothetical protein [Alteribacter salitolerans]RNA66821.1 hypothetical protein EBO34_16575 [Alteribacter keqinensis]